VKEPYRPVMTIMKYSYTVRNT